MAGDTEPAVALLEIARRERRAHGAQLLPQPRPEQRQIRLHDELLGLDLAVLDPLDP